MRIEDVRNNPEYAELKNKILSYERGCRFRIGINQNNTDEQKKAMQITLDDCKREGLIKNVSLNVDLLGDYVEEEFERI